MSSHLVSDLERICDCLVVLVASRIQAAGRVSDLLARHHLISGSSVDPGALPDDAETISAARGLGQTSLLARAAAIPEQPGWHVTRPSLEDVVLAYMSRAGGATEGSAAHSPATGGTGLEAAR
jgi:ABC-2 type transport system ATP-binding protein